MTARLLFLSTSGLLFSFVFSLLFKGTFKNAA